MSYSPHVPAGGRHGDGVQSRPARLPPGGALFNEPFAHGGSRNTIWLLHEEGLRSFELRIRPVESHPLHLRFLRRFSPITKAPPNS